MSKKVQLKFKNLINKIKYSLLFLYLLTQKNMTNAKNQFLKLTNI